MNFKQKISGIMYKRKNLFKNIISPGLTNGLTAEAALKILEDSFLL